MKSTMVLVLAALCAVACGSSDTGADAPPIILDPEDGGANPGTPDAMISTPGDPDANVTGAACDVGSCNTCQMCSQSGPPGTCMDENAACGASQQCLDFYECITPCTDQPCFDACQTMHPDGANQYLELVACVFCGDCYNTCDGASIGCPAP